MVLVLVYLPILTKLGDFLQANVGIHIPAQWFTDGYNSICQWTLPLKSWVFPWKMAIEIVSFARQNCYWNSEFCHSKLPLEIMSFPIQEVWFSIVLCKRWPEGKSHKIPPLSYGSSMVFCRNQPTSRWPPLRDVEPEARTQIGTPYYLSPEVGIWGRGGF